ncbi:MAG TPA: hypothetical protein VIK29_07300 [Paludibacter sp.]
MTMIIKNDYIKAMGIIAILSMSFFACQAQKSQLNANLNKMQQASMMLELAAYDSAHVIETRLLQIDGTKWSSELEFAGAKWLVQSFIQKLENTDNAYEVRLSGKIISGEALNVSLGFMLKFDHWQNDNYVVLPGAVYNGNRYRSTLKARKVQTETAIKKHPGKGPLITNVPRLSLLPGESLLQQLAGDLSTPSIGLQNTQTSNGLWLLTTQGTSHGDYSFKVWENEKHDKANITVRMPGVRQDSIYKGGGKPFFPSMDKGANLKVGDALEVACQLHLFPCNEIPTLFDYFLTIRENLGDQTISNLIPRSKAWEILQTKYNAQNWVDEFGYYSVGMRESKYQDWQTGWVGGMNTVYPLLVSGDEITKQRVMRTFNFLFDTISPSGLFYEIFYDGNWQDTDGTSFLRRNSDALYFILKSFVVLKEEGKSIPENWESAAKGCADRFVEIWDEYHEFGQIADFETGKLVVKGTSSNGIVFGALVLASNYFNKAKYLTIARESGEYYFQEYVKKGISNGGPGDIYQGIDSESAFGLLESYIVLYEVTHEEKWLEYAKATANLCATWVVSYNFKFPGNSTFAKLNMETTGTVIANIQNKHAAPGICTLSGNSLFKLYRYTGNALYLQLIQQITKTIPQYMSRADRPIPDVRPDVPWPIMPPGWINERVNLSDWEERGTPGDIKRGEIFGGSTWAEATYLNSYAELPDVFVKLKTAEVVSFDHIEASLKENSTLILLNPTKFAAKVRVLIDTSKEVDTEKNSDITDVLKVVEIEAGDSQTIQLDKI